MHLKKYMVENTEVVEVDYLSLISDIDELNKGYFDIKESIINLHETRNQLTISQENRDVSTEIIKDIARKIKGKLITWFNKSEGAFKSLSYKCDYLLKDLDKVDTIKSGMTTIDFDLKTLVSKDQDINDFIKGLKNLSIELHPIISDDITEIVNNCRSDLNSILFDSDDTLPKLFKSIEKNILDYFSNLNKAISTKGKIINGEISKSFDSKNYKVLSSDFLVGNKVIISIQPRITLQGSKVNIIKNADKNYEILRSGGLMFMEYNSATDFKTDPVPILEKIKIKDILEDCKEILFQSTNYKITEEGDYGELETNIYHCFQYFSDSDIVSDKDADELANIIYMFANRLDYQESTFTLDGINLCLKTIPKILSMCEKMIKKYS